MDDDSDLSDAQKEALDEITHLMREHFEGGVLIVETDSSKLEQDESITKIRYHGGLTRGIGLADVAHHKLLQRCN